MDREKLRQELGQQLQEFGFKRGNSLDSRMDVYILCGKPILGRPNHRTEVSVDFYGWKITLPEGLWSLCDGKEMD